MDISALGRVIETDVLVLGAGANGCGAAIGAAEQGANVVVVDKGVLESCGQAGPGNVGLRVYLETGPEWDSAETFTKFNSGTAGELGGSSRVFHRAITKQIIPMFKRLEHMGIEFHKNADGSYRRSQAFGQPGPWFALMKNGKDIKTLLAKEVRKAGAEAIGHLMITKLLVGNGRVAGAVGFNIRNGEFYIFKAKSVVIALGQRQVRFTANSTGNPFNCWNAVHNTGSGLVLAYEAGAKIVGLDVLDSANIVPKGYGQAGIAAFVGMGAHMLNALGQRYMPRYHPMAERALRNTFVLATYQEQIEGRGPCYLDCKHLSEKDLEFMITQRLFVDGATYPEYFEQRRLDLKKDLVEIEVGELGGGGFLLVGEECESTLNGLFGYSPREMLFALCAGFSSGTEAGRAALKIPSLSEIDVGLVGRGRERVFAPMKRDDGYTPRELEDAIKQVMNYYMGYIRNQKSMEVALNSLELIEAHIDEMKANNYHELLRAHEALHLLKYCQLMSRACMERKESGRSFYRRSDYPNLDEAWAKQWVVQWQEHGEPRISAEPLDKGD